MSAQPPKLFSAAEGGFYYKPVINAMIIPDWLLINAMRKEWIREAVRRLAAPTAATAVSGGAVLRAPPSPISHRCTVWAMGRVSDAVYVPKIQSCVHSFCTLPLHMPTCGADAAG